MVKYWRWTSFAMHNTVNENDWNRQADVVYVRGSEYDALAVDLSNHRNECSELTMELAEANRRIAALEAALKEAATVVWGCRNFMLAGREREFVYAAKRYYEVLGSVPDEVIRATSDDIDDDSESETDPKPDQWVQDGKVFEEDADRCRNMAHKRYNLFGCTECDTSKIK